jgi:hypothetical protein
MCEFLISWWLLGCEHMAWVVPTRLDSHPGLAAVPTGGVVGYNHTASA